MAMPQPEITKFSPSAFLRLSSEEANVNAAVDFYIDQIEKKLVKQKGWAKDTLWGNQFRRLVKRLLENKHIFVEGQSKEALFTILYKVAKDISEGLRGIVAESNFFLDGKYLKELFEDRQIRAFIKSGKAVSISVWPELKKADDTPNTNELIENYVAQIQKILEKMVPNYAFSDEHEWVKQFREVLKKIIARDPRLDIATENNKFYEIAKYVLTHLASAHEAKVDITSVVPIGDSYMGGFFSSLGLKFEAARPATPVKIAVSEAVPVLERKISRTEEEAKGEEVKVGKFVYKKSMGVDKTQAEIDYYKGIINAGLKKLLGSKEEIKEEAPWFKQFEEVAKKILNRKNIFRFKKTKENSEDLFQIALHFLRQVSWVATATGGKISSISTEYIPLDDEYLARFGVSGKGSKIIVGSGKRQETVVADYKPKKFFLFFSNESVDAINYYVKQIKAQVGVKDEENDDQFPWLVQFKDVAAKVLQRRAGFFSTWRSNLPDLFQTATYVIEQVSYRCKKEEEEKKPKEGAPTVGVGEQKSKQEILKGIDGVIGEKYKESLGIIPRADVGLVRQPAFNEELEEAEKKQEQESITVGELKSPPPADDSLKTGIANALEAIRRKKPEMPQKPATPPPPVVEMPRVGLPRKPLTPPAGPIQTTTYAKPVRVMERGEVVEDAAPSSATPPSGSETGGVSVAELRRKLASSGGGMYEKASHGVQKKEVAGKKEGRPSQVTPGGHHSGSR